MKPEIVTTKYLYDGIKSLTGKDSAYSVAKFLEATPVSARNWRDGKTMDDNNARKAAIALGLNPEYVIACIHAERVENSNSDSEIVAIWRHIALRLATAASVGFFA